MLDFYDKLNGLYKRAVCTKMIGFIFSLFIVLTMIYGYGYTKNVYFLWGMLFWYPTIGGIMGLMGLMDKHPLFPNFKFVYVRGILIGGFMNFMLTLIAFNQIADVARTLLGPNLSNGTVFCLAILEGAMVAGFMDWVATKKYGEGEQLMHVKGESGYEVKLHDSEL